MTDEKMRKSARKKYRERRRKSAGAVISAIIKDSPKSQSQIAEEIGISEDTMTDIVTGRRKVEIADYELIARAVGIDPLWIIKRVIEWNQP